MMKSIRSFTAMMAVAALGMMINPAPVFAQDGKVIGESGKWTAFRAGSGKNKVCFITSEPTKPEGKYNRDNRGETRVFVTHHGKDSDDRGVVSSVAGYRYKEGEEVIFSIDGKKFNLFSVDTRAWATKPQQDKAIVKSMKRGNRLKVTGISSRGNKTIDTYSLKGFTKAMSIIDKACL
mgnify:FL=1